MVFLCPLPKNGFYLSPSIFTNATPSMRIACEEIFGPVLTTMTFRTPDEAVTKANNSPYGLSAGVWTEKARGRWAWPRRCGPVSSGTTRSIGSIRQPASAATRNPASAEKADRRVWPPT